MITNYKKMSVRKAVGFYKNLLKKDKIELGGVAHRRLKELQERLKNKMGWVNKK
tara:strand:- start:320 stop:481 length:162 start_codon:yes stop_codon:yes gene_type:complete